VVATGDVTVGPAAALTPAAAPSQQVLASNRYRNVPVLGELDVSSFDATMQSLTQWVSPQAGCGHCHVDGDWASEAKSTKQVARQMLQMVQHLNTNWKPHVGPSGVTCYTCHRGQPQPPALSRPGLTTVALTGAGSGAGPARAATEAEQADEQFAQMLHYDEALGTDCTQCHDRPNAASGAVADPSDSARRAAQKARAAQGQRLLKDINSLSLTATTAGPPSAIATCATCHQGGRRPGADGAPQARDHLALTLAPIERDGGGPAPVAGVRQVAGGDACATAALAAARSGTRIGAESGLRPVIGTQALVLYAAPDTGCAMLDLHLHAGDTVEAYVNHAGYTSVRYRRPATGSEARGWVRSDRLGPGSSVSVAAAPDAAARQLTAATLTASACQTPAAGDAAAQPLARARRQVLGKGRLQFYSAPDETCPLRGIFILPGEPVVTLQQAARFTAVHYVNPRTGGQAQGWVLSERLGGG
jgi:photosynthetic reaction center cytochrome c subunit